MSSFSFSQQTVRKSRVNPHVKRVFGNTLVYVLLALGGAAVCFPFVWMILTSFKNYAEAIATPPTIFPGNWGVRLALLPDYLASFPLVGLAFILWMALGVFISRKIRDTVIAVLYVLAHLALFFVLGNLPLMGEGRLVELWQRTAAQAGIELDSFTANYVEAWGRAPFGAYFKNSIFVSVLTPLLVIATSAPAAYAFARLRFPFQNVLFMFYLATMMVPSEVLLIPNFITISELGWRNTYFALIVPFMVSVMSIFFMRQFFRSIPNDLYDAATIDGCGHIRFLISIAMPLARPALVSTTMFNFLGSWNALLWPLLVTDQESMRPIALGLASFANEAGMQPQLYMAAATFTIAPVLILFLFVQKQFIEGIATSGLK
ncbi:MAG: carbohydrate ABC transporter permease [Chloroflexi bacterium]|nr:carbohydrate ABC transporter permease [Chloroflexota bacterium]